MADFSHLSSTNQAQMVDISQKNTSLRSARVSGRVSVKPETLEKLGPEGIKEVSSVARVAGIQAAKQTALLVPMCHQVPLSSVTIEVTTDPKGFFIRSEARSSGKTGVEMEGLVAVQMAATCIYDMIKADCPEALVGPFRLERKEGGKSGVWEAQC